MILGGAAYPVMCALTRPRVWGNTELAAKIKTESRDERETLGADVIARHTSAFYFQISVEQTTSITTSI